jgi:hypothetical protein
VLNKILPLVLLLMLGVSNLPAQGIDARFTVDKTIHFSGEPIFITLTVSNKGDKPVWAVGLQEVVVVVLGRFRQAKVSAYDSC